MHVASVIPNDVVSAFQEARAFLKQTLHDSGASGVGVWGCGETGEVVVQLLGASGIPVAAVYDAFKVGEFCGRPIRNPYVDLVPGLPVIVASARAPEELRDVSDYLARRGIKHFFAGAPPASEVPLARFKGIHHGQRCFVAGNGPSLNQIDMRRLAREITFGSNRVYYGFPQWGFDFTYWSIEDKMVAADIRDEWNRMNGPTKFIPADMLDLVSNRQNVVPVAFLRKQFGEGRPLFSDDPSRLYWGGTVTYVLLQLAVIMGCRPIYLIGVDFHYVRPDHVKELDHPCEWISDGDDPNHFFPGYFGKGRRWHDPAVDRMGRCYEAARAYCDAHDIPVLNATPGTRLAAFERVEFDDIFS